MKVILHNKPCLGEEEIQAVQHTLESGWIIAGKEVEKFENDFKKHIGVLYAIALNSGTAALHVSLLALGVKNGDEVIVPTYTASDILNAIYYVGATPVLVDSAKNTCLVDTEKVGEKISNKTKAMIIPHTFGIPADISLLRRYNIPIIEDCAQAIGTLLHGKPVGSFGDISIFSFYATKLLTTGQGGMVVTNKKSLYTCIKDSIDYNGRDNYKVRYNYPLTDIAASIGKAQLQKYADFSKRRKEIMHQYQRVLEEKNIFHLPKKSDSSVVPFRFVFAKPKKITAEHIKHMFLEKKIEVIQPVAPYELLHRLLHKNNSDFPNAEQFAKTVISIPLYPCLLDKEINKIISALQQIL